MLGLVSRWRGQTPDVCLPSQRRCAHACRMACFSLTLLDISSAVRPPGFCLTVRSSRTYALAAKRVPPAMLGSFRCSVPLANWNEHYKLLRPGCPLGRLLKQLRSAFLQWFAFRCVAERSRHATYAVAEPVIMIATVPHGALPLNAFWFFPAGRTRRRVRLPAPLPLAATRVGRGRAYLRALPFCCRFIRVPVFTTRCKYGIRHFGWLRHKRAGAWFRVAGLPG